VAVEIYDWEIPKEWIIKEAWIKNNLGQKIIDFEQNNLHVLQYSQPIHKYLKLNELKKHLFYLKELPDAIPYKTSYYGNNWSFCITYNDYLKYFKNNHNEEFEVLIDTKFKNGNILLADYIKKGRFSNEYIFSTYICHPQLANDNTSGIVLTVLLAKEISKKQTNYTYRFIFVPETIGALTYLHLIRKNINDLIGGLLLLVLVVQVILVIKKHI